MSSWQIMALRVIVLPLLKVWTGYLHGKAAATPDQTDDKLAGSLAVVIKAAEEVTK